MSHSDRGDLKHLHQSLQVLNAEDMAQPWHCPTDSPGGVTLPFSPAEVMGEGVAAC